MTSRFSSIPRGPIGLIATFVGDPHVTERVEKQRWNGHRVQIFQAICDSWRRDPVLFNFFPSEGQMRFLHGTNYSRRTSEEATKAYIETYRNPVLCVQIVFHDVVSELRHDYADGNNLQPVLSRTEVGTLDNIRLTGFLKRRTVDALIKLCEKEMPAGANKIGKSQTAGLGLANTTYERGLKERARILNELIPKAKFSNFRLRNETFLYCFPKQFALPFMDCEQITLEDQRFITLPRSIGKCTRLKNLSLSHSCFQFFPEEIGQCKELESVNLLCTNILRLDELDQCPKLKEIRLDDDRLKNLHLTPRTVVLLKRLKISVPDEEDNPYRKEAQRLELPPPNMEEMDLEKMAGPSPVSGPSFRERVVSCLTFNNWW